MYSQKENETISPATASKLLTEIKILKKEVYTLKDRLDKLDKESCKLDPELGEVICDL